MIDRAIDINQFDYSLPDERIARYPLAVRDESKLLLYQHGNIETARFSQLSDYFKTQDLLVFNNTKVVPARLLFLKPTGTIIEILCLDPIQPLDYQQMFSHKKTVRWKCMVGNMKRWKDTFIELSFIYHQQKHVLSAKLVSREPDGIVIEFSWTGDLTFAEVLEGAGHVPIPPYLMRDEDLIDRERYQTVYSRAEGSVAAPTAGLHFTDSVFESLNQKSVDTDFVTLHVGAGTFLPVKTNDARQHNMHSERFVVTRNTIQNLIDHLGCITAVGTTSVRTLETLYWLGVKKIAGWSAANHLAQWEAYELPQSISVKEALNALLENAESPFEADTSIMIVPGYQFRIVNRLITNFHQPRSTLLLLVSAFVGDENRKRIYEYALRYEFRFLSYGDSSLLIP